MPATRAYGSLLNVTPGLTVDNNGLAATPTMTFFSAHGGQTNEGRMQINGMTVAAAFNGGGVSSLTYDSNNVDEVSVLVSGGLGETETGGPTMNIVPRSGGNRFSGQAFFNGAGDWSRGDNIDHDAALRRASVTRRGIIRPGNNATVGGPIERDRLWFFGSYRKFSITQGVEGASPTRSPATRRTGTSCANPRFEARNIQGRDIWDARVTAQLTRSTAVLLARASASLRGSTLTRRAARVAGSAAPTGSASAT